MLGRKASQIGLCGERACVMKPKCDNMMSCYNARHDSYEGKNGNKTDQGNELQRRSLEEEESVRLKEWSPTDFCTSQDSSPTKLEGQNMDAVIRPV